MVEYIAKNLAIELMHQSSYLSDGDLLEVNGNLAKARIEAEPAADVVPVIHGRWMPYRCDMYECSVCQRIHTSFDKEKCDADYCPHCGAKMDGDDEYG